MTNQPQTPITEQDIVELNNAIAALSIQRDTLRAELALVTLANKNANSLIGSQAEENDKINGELKAANTKLRAALKRMEQIYEQIKENI